MAIERIRIDYTVYPPNHQRGGICWDFRTFSRAKTAARGLGCGSRVYRNFNQTNKRGQALGDWWGGEHFWIWDGKSFCRKLDEDRFNGADSSH
jgi:hypothetical protein